MTELIDLLRTRRSIRKFTGEPVDEAAIEVLSETLVRAFSSKGKSPWEFVLVDDGDSLERLSKAKPHGASFVEGAALAVVVLADEKRSDVWVEDCAIASALVHMQAHALGLGSCWVQIRKRPHDDTTDAEAYVRGVVGAPDHLKVLSMVAMGHPAEEKPAHEREALPWTKVRRGRYGGDGGG